MQMKMKKQNILFIISSLGLGGAQKIITLLANSFALKGATITLLTLTDENKNPALFSTNSKVIRKNIILEYSSKNIIDTIKNNFIRIIYLSKTIKKINPEIVLSFITETNILSIIASKIVKKKIIISERISPYFNDLDKKWKILRRFIYPLADLLVVLTQDVKEYYHKHGIKRIEVIPNPIKQYPNNKNNRSRKNIILFVGRLHKQKGIDILIKAFSMLKTKSWSLLIIGDGEERQTISSLISNLGLETKVKLIGKRKNIGRYYRESSIFVLPSYYEGFPNALLEAMSYGCACISSNCKSGPSEIIKNYENGILFEPGNIEELHKKLSILIKNKKLRKKMSNNAQKISHIFSLKNTIGKWLQVLS